MSEDLLYWLDQISPAHRTWVGDKAFYLGLLSQKGYPVIPGAVISAAVFQAFLEQIHWVAPLFADLPNSSLHVDVDNSRQLQNVAQQIQQAIQTTTYSASWLDQLEEVCQQWQAPALILRPSLAVPTIADPTISSKSAGILPSEVCRCDRQSVIQSLKRVWASLFRAKSLLYWQRLRIQLQQIRLAVLVQPLRSAVISGEVQVQDYQLDVSATWGLGRAIVQGEVIPDRFHLDLQTGAQSQHLGVKRYAYRIATEPEATGLASAAPENTPSASLLHLQDCYEVYPLKPLQQTQLVLSSSQIQQLVHLAQQITMEIGTSLKLEWIYGEGDSPQPELKITQVSPCLGTRRWREEEIKVWQDQTTIAQPFQITADANDRHDRIEFSADPSQSGQPLQPLLPAPLAIPSVVTGLAAAPGKIAAAAWVVPSSTLSVDPVDSSDCPPPGRIIVAVSITPDLLPWIKQASGIITEQGGMTSHGAILARELGIPAITGVSHATHLIQTGAQLMMDGDRGEIELGKGGVESSPPSDPQSPPIIEGQAPAALNLLTPSQPVQAPIATQLWVTLSQTSAISQVMNLPVDGVGLLRSELMLLEVLEQRHPSLWIAEGQREELISRIVGQVQQFAQAFAPRPVFYRSSDWRSHEFTRLASEPLPPEPNPMLGLRGTLSYQINSALFEVELAALRQVQQAGYSNVSLLLPFVRTVEEFHFCRQQVERVGLSQNPHFQLWIMAEVPSVLLLLPDYIASGVQGIAIGCNDLTQLLLGVDRDQPQLASAFDSCHPVVMRAIQQLIQTARQADLPCSICGYAPGQHLAMVDALVRWGITAISVEPGAIAGVHQAIGRAEQRLLLEAARQRLS